MVAYNWCIDVGNSSIKWGVFEENRLLKCFQFRENPQAEEIKMIEENYPPSQVGYASVRGDLDWLSHAKAREFTAFEIGSFEVDYKKRSEMGVDRLAAAIGAKNYFQNVPAILVVDVGTCITYTGVFHELISGLAISPGLQMRWNAMHHFTAQLPLLVHEEQIHERGTLQNLQCGGLWGWQMELKGMIDLFCEREQIDQVVITGTDVVHLEKHFKDQYNVVEYLNLWGLNYWLNEG